MFDIPALLLFLASIVHCQLCYTPSGGILKGYGPCNPTYAASLCCAVGDHCLSNSLCETANSIFYRGGCTSKAYLSGECPSFCGTGIPYFPPGIPPNSGGSAIRVRLCNPTNSKTSERQFCCDIDGTGGCCESSINDLDLSDGSSTMTARPATSTSSALATPAGTPASRFLINYSQTRITTTARAVPTISRTSTASEASTPAKATSSAAPQSSINATAIGAGIGAGLGGVVAMVGVLICCRAYRRHKKHKSLIKRGHKPQPSIFGGKEVLSSNSLLALSANHSWMTMSPSTPVELPSPLAPHTSAFRAMPLSPSGGPFELAANSIAGRAELPGDLPPELPEQASSHNSQEMVRSKSTRSKKLKILNRAIFRSPSFSPWRPPAELASTPASTPASVKTDKSVQTLTRAKSQSRSLDARTSVQRDHTQVIEGASQTSTRAKSQSQSRSLDAKSSVKRKIKQAAEALVPSQTSTGGKSESCCSSEKSCVNHERGRSSEARAYSSPSAEPKSGTKNDTAKGGVQHVGDEEKESSHHDR